MSDINDENKDKSGYDANKLNVALADIKSAIAKAKESKGELTEDDVRKIVEDTLKNYKLDQVVTGNQVNVIINFAFNLSKSDILNNEDFTKTLKDLKQSIVAQAGDSFSNIDLNLCNKAIQDGGNILAQFGKLSLISSRVLVLRSIHGIIDGNRIVAVFFCRPIEREENVKEK